MTVAELIARLSEFPMDALVVTAGFDGAGLEDVATVQSVFLSMNANSGGHCGPHVIGTDQDPVAVYIDRA